MLPPGELPTLPTTAERTAAGKQARARVPRSSHGTWTPAPDRRDPIEILEQQALTRLPNLVPIRYGRMLASPFAFFRGAAAVMAADLAGTPNAGQTVQACGDAHLVNFGIFASPEREMLFDVNDFDETLPGPWEWDVKRLAASATVAARQNGHEPHAQAEAARVVASAYREAMRTFAAEGNLDLWYAKLDVDELSATLRDNGAVERARTLGRLATKARAKNSLRAFAKLTCTTDGVLQIKSDPPLILPLSDIGARFGVGVDTYTERLNELVESYRASLPEDRQQLLAGYQLRDVAHKVVGVGSVGTRAFIILMTGRDDQDPLFLQAKEAQASVLERYVGASRLSTHGQRVVVGQRIMQSAGDILLGWFSTRGFDGQHRDFYVRQLWDGKGSADVDAMEPGLLAAYLQLCAWTLARAHARSGDRVAIAAYLGSGTAFDKAIVAFAKTYADVNERDHAALAAAVASGRVQAADAI